MEIQGLRDIGAYHGQLKRVAEERRNLVADLLMGHTEFFLEPSASDAFADRVLRPLFDSDAGSFRLWVPSCSTGEEVYSIAIRIAEIAAERADERRWDVFGTDADRDALSAAEKGVFEERKIGNVSQARRERFFSDLGDGRFAVNDRLRSLCNFAPHSLLRDPPLSELDAICCRNLLIYLNELAKSDLLAQFHHGLRPGGALWLGPSETADTSAHAFEPLDADARIYRRRGHRPDRLTPSAERAPSSGALAPGFGTQPQLAETAAARTFLEDLAPPFAALSTDGRIVFLSKTMAQLIASAAGGKAITAGDQMPEALRAPVMEAVERAAAAASLVEGPGIEYGGSAYAVKAVPMRGAVDTVVVTLAPVPHSMAEPDTLAGSARDFDAMNSRCEGANRDLLEANEDLRAFNEELKTSREELQAANAELETVNRELGDRHRDAAEAHEDLENLFAATRLATLFLDDGLAVRRFTPELRKLFRVRDIDVGRPISELATSLDYRRLEADARKTRETGKPLSREVTTKSGEQTFDVVLRPFQGQPGGGSGIVLTFSDITDRKEASDRLAEAADRMARQYGELEALYDALPIGLCLVDREHRWIRMNAALTEINGISQGDSIGADARQKLAGVASQIEPLIERVFATGKALLNREISGETPAAPGKERYWHVDFFPVRDNNGIFAVGTAVREVTAERELEKRAEAGEALFRELFDGLPAGASLHEGATHRCQQINAFYASATGMDRDDADAVFRAAWRHDLDRITEGMGRVFATGEALLVSDLCGAWQAGNGGWSTMNLLPRTDDDGRVTGVLAFAIDTTDRAQARREVTEERRRLRRLRDSLAVFIGLLDGEGRVLDVNRLVLERSAVAREDVIGRPFWDCYWWNYDTDRQAELKSAFGKVLEGKSVRYDTDVRIADDETIRIDFQMVPAFDDQGRVVEVVPSGIDISERVEAENRREALLEEVEHRVKNALATVQAVTRFTARSAKTLASFEAALLGRVAVISRTHDLLTAAGWQGVALSTLIDCEIVETAWGKESRIAIAGDDPCVPPDKALTLALALHELMRNAKDHGALASPDGRIAVRIVGEGEALRSLVWEETRVSDIAVERPAGFGTYLLESVLEREFDMQTSVHFGSDGLKFVLGETA